MIVNAVECRKRMYLRILIQDTKIYSSYQQTYKSQSKKSSNKIGFRKLVHNTKVKQKKIGTTGTRRGPEIETNTYDYIAMSPCAM